MQEQNLDFCFLGDTNPEGLLLAAGLARRGYAVGIVSSGQLGELPAQFSWPLLLPERLGEHRLDEFLFRVGFFRLEESGLTPERLQAQYVLPKRRLSFDGLAPTWTREAQREFPLLSEKIIKIRDSMRRSSNRSVSKSLSQLTQLIRQDPDVGRWITMDAGQGRLAYHDFASDQSKTLEKWLWGLVWPETKCYRPQKNLVQPLASFLLEHAKKWGAKMIQEPTEISSRFSSFVLNSNWRAKNLMINSLGGFRSLAKAPFADFSHEITHWLYFDRVRCSEEMIPEPLEEFCQFHNSEKQEFPYILHTQRSSYGDESEMRLGVWLKFQDSSHWISQVEDARVSLKKLMPFLPSHCFSSLPSLLDLNELKGETIRRGEIDRLIIWKSSEPKWDFITRWMPKWGAAPAELPQISKRVFLCIPFLGGPSDRRESLLSCFKILEHFEKKRAKLGGSHAN